MDFKNLTSRVKQSIADYKENQEQKRADEEARQNEILAGHFEPICVNCNLENGEKAYLELSADRMALVDRIEEHTTGKSKKKGVVGRAVVGGLLLGPLGALGGAVTAGSKDNSKTVQKTITSVQKIDTGRLVFTNQRLFFIGSNVISLPYKEIISAEFPKSTKLVLKYQGMQNGEFFNLSGANVKDSNLYYIGIGKK